MTTSKNHRSPSDFANHGDHWLALTATLCRKSTDQFGDWLQEELVTLESDLSGYVTPRSLGKTLRRQSSDPVS